MTKKLILHIVALFLMLSSGTVLAEEGESIYNLSASLGAGYGHFFNDFENVGSSEIRENNPSFMGRIMWEPDNRLSLGLESGYYALFDVDNLPAHTGNDVMHSTMNLVPIFLSVTMRVYDNFYASFASGYSIMNYTVKSNEGTSEGSDLSLSNFSGSFSYLFNLGKDWDLGTELRYFRIGLTEDNYINLNVFIKFDFLSY